MVAGFTSVSPCVWLSFVLIFGPACTSGHPYSEVGEDLYDYEATNEDIIVGGDKSEEGKRTEVMATPRFISQPQSVIVNEGDTIRLPCMVDRLEGFVMLWKKNKDIITVASQIIDKRVRLEEQENGNHLVLGQAAPADEGVYTCQISAYKLTELTHTVQIRVKPVISTTPDEVLIVNAGSQATLVCNILSGTPTPEVRWRRKEKKLPTGEEEIVGTTLSFSQVTRQHAGYYLCMADNGFGPSPVQKEVKLVVHYAPEIEVENVLIQTKYGEEEEIVCTVHASPHANVTWLKDGVIIDTNTPNTVITKKHNHHSLTLLSVDEKTTGQYSCVAKNTMGKGMQSVMVSGMARKAIITSAMDGSMDNEYTLEWHATSRTPITQFQVSVRKVDSIEWDIYDVEAESPAGGDDYHGHLHLVDLQQAALYQVRVVSRNRFGFNQPGEVFIFGTKGADAENKQAAMTAAVTELRPTMAIMIVILGNVIQF